MDLTLPGQRVHHLCMTSPLALRVAADIRAELGRRKMSQAELARALGKSDMFVSRRISDGTSLELADLEAIANVLGLPVSHFMPAEVATS